MKSLINLFFIFIIYISNPLIAQDTITNFVRLDFKGSQQVSNVVGFKLQNIDTMGNFNWRSPLITTFEGFDGWSYLLKINVPTSVLKNTKEAWCTAFARKDSQSELDSMQYGGVTLSNIKLNINSTPDRAEAFLIPNRIWMQKIQGTHWKSDNTILEKYRVDRHRTNTSVIIDETVFVVIYKLKNKYMKIIHNTQPMNVAKEQTVWANFE